MHQNAKQMMGLEDPANRTQQAVERTAPVGLALYGLTLVWFHRDGPSVAVVPRSAVVSGQGGAVVRGHPGGVAAGELAGSIRGCGLGAGWSRNPACAAYRVCQPRGLIDVPRRRSPPTGASSGLENAPSSAGDVFIVRMPDLRNPN